MYLSLNRLSLDQAASTCMVATDLTEQKRHEQVLAAEELARSILEQAAEPMVVCDSAGTIIRASQAAHDLCGSNPAMQPFQKAFPLQPVERKDRLPDAADGMGRSLCLEDIAAGKPCHGMEMVLKRHDGQVLNVLVSGRPLLSRQGQILGSVVSLTNITQRKQAEEALRVSEERFRSLITASSDVLYRMSPDWSEMRQLSSQRFLAATEEPDRDWLGQYILAEDQPQVMAAIQEATRAKSVFQFEHRVRRVDGSVGWTLSRAVPLIDANGRITEWFGAASDITDRKRAEQQLKELNDTLERRVTERTAELERRAAQLRALTPELTLTEHRERQRLAKVLHDHLQQLLVGARFNVASIQSQVGEPQVRQSLDQINGLLDESVQASRSLTAELFPPVLQEGTFAEALQWLIRWMQDKHGLLVHTKFGENAEPQAQEIRLLLFEATRELLFNIVKHAGVREAWLEVERYDAGQIRITIADSGRGFDPTSVRPADRAEGGFGMVSIRERLGLLGGRVEIESTLGRGTRATLIAPLRTQGPPSDD